MLAIFPGFSNNTNDFSPDERIRKTNKKYLQKMSALLIL